jgi:hypothetical protein
MNYFRKKKKNKNKKHVFGKDAIDTINFIYNSIPRSGIDNFR